MFSIRTQLLPNIRLLVVTIITSFCADFRTCQTDSCRIILIKPRWYSSVVASIEETATRYHIPKAFIGLILLPIVVSTSLLSALIASHRRTIGKCCRACHIRMDGYEGQVRIDHWHLRRKLDRKSKAFLFIRFDLTERSQQIATFVVPLLVIIGWGYVILPHRSTLSNL